MSLRASEAGALTADRLIIVIQNIRQLRMQNIEIRLASRSAVRNLESSALQPDLRILWKTSIFHRSAYQQSILTASCAIPPAGP